MDTGEKRQFLTIVVENQEYGIDILSVKEIRGWEETTPLPNTQNYIRGVIHLRGEVLPILDLRSYIGLGTTTISKAHVIMVVSLEGGIAVGILADSVSDMLSTFENDILSVQHVDQGCGPKVISGIVCLDSRNVEILNLHAILEDILPQDGNLDFSQGGNTVLEDKIAV